MTSIIIDTNVIIDSLEKQTLESLFKEIIQKADTIWITPDVRRELQEKLNDEQRIRFETLLKKEIKKGNVEASRHKFRLKQPYKELAQYLKTFPVRLQRTDRNLIALKYQIRGKIITNDEGIKQAILLLRTKNTRWRNRVLSIESPAEEGSAECK